MSVQKEMYKATIIGRLGRGPATIPAMAVEEMGKTRGTSEYELTKEYLKQAMRALASDDRVRCVGVKGRVKTWALTEERRDE